jgi:organic radical activating enzyme
MKLNQQPIEKLIHRDDGVLDVHSVFYTIQGEGPFAGRPAVFVRLAGCNLQCPQCDTDYTSSRTLLPVAALVEMINEENHAATLVVITGGEPFRQNIAPLVEALDDGGYQVQIETNGTLYNGEFPFSKAVVICSPKAGQLAKGFQLNPRAITAFKYVAQASTLAFDGLPTLALAHPASPQVARPPEGFIGPVYLQPVDERNITLNDDNLAACVKSCKQHGYTLGIQLHKHIGEL